MKDPLFIEQMIRKAKEAGEKVLAEFDHLSNVQLNWKPSEDKWSIAQCLDHLIISDSLYFPILEKIAVGNHEMTWWERKNPFSNFLGRILISQVGEKVKKKMKTPKVFAPAASHIDQDIILHFNSHLDKLIKLIENCPDSDLDKIIITSPASKAITYSLRDAVSILTGHLHRHITQAMRVKADKEFPMA